MGIGPNPVCKGLLDQGLLALGDGGLLPVQHGGFPAVLVRNVVEDPHILEVQRLLQNLVAVDPARAVGAVDLDVPVIPVLAFDVPFPGVPGEAHMHIPLAVARGREQLEHELLHDLRRQPGCAEADGDFRRRQIGGLDALKGFYVDLIVGGAELRALSGLP